MNVTPFEAALAFVLSVEGGYSDGITAASKHDRGGATNHGISIEILRLWRDNPGLKAGDVLALTIEEAKTIYRGWYWDMMNLDQVVDLRLKMLLFDQGVNRGVGTAVLGIQKVLSEDFGYQLTKDAMMGPKTLQAINQADPLSLMIEYLHQAQHGYVKIVLSNPSQIVFLKGWLSRTQKLMKLLLGLRA